ncbi:hypothetical protein DBR47_20775 [Paucibacter sp. KBW04]|uniref:type IV pilus modification PilV family protein n=1 Tax=Paucibacter sp. KBW04 TaxID=2153361 RepID=UPI000F55F455|nr:type II secretion system protein [Paucibacter sp. KBW04]RQO55313.1 hypothetical protein DBR47_20775 [Paucibacter sp. KBW04]
MSRATETGASGLSRQRGLSLIELILFIVVVSAALAGVLRVFLQAGSSSADPQAQRQALAIAESLMEEVQLMPFTFCDGDDANLETAADSTGCSSQAEAMGPEAGENRFTTPQFDNVNDYHGYVMSGGIRDINNQAVVGLEAYSASVQVTNSALGSISQASGDALMITVSVTGPHGVQVQLSGFRSRYAPNAGI